MQGDRERSGQSQNRNMHVYERVPTFKKDGSHYHTYGSKDSS